MRRTAGDEEIDRDHARGPVVGFVVTGVGASRDGACPDGYPVKAGHSGIFHVEGGAFYERTVPDRCYRDPQAAEADGYRPARR